MNENETIRMPLIDGYIVNDELVIIKCQICGGVHHHSNDNYTVGTMTTRIPHCKDTNVRNVCIVVKGHMERSTFNQFYKWRRASKKRTFEPKYIGFPIDKVGMN